jgi:Domain of unknown function (DUF4129)
VTGVERSLRRARSGPLFAVLALSGLLVLVMAAAIVSGPRATRLPLPTATPPAATAETGQDAVPVPSFTMTPPPLAEDEAAPLWLRIVVLVIVGLVVGAVVVLAVYLVRRYGRRIVLRPAGPGITASTEAVEPPVDEIRAAVDAGIDELADDAADPRRAVIGCWLRLERAAAAAGTPRNPDDTPADLVHRVLAAHQVSPLRLESLADLYRRARYAPGPVDQAMRSEARETLTALRAELSSRGGGHADTAAQSSTGTPAATP